MRLELMHKESTIKRWWRVFIKKKPKVPPKRDEAYHRSIMSIREVDMKKLIKEVLEWKKLVLVKKEPQWARVPLTRYIIRKLLPLKFKMPQLLTFLVKKDLYEYIQNFQGIMLIHRWKDTSVCHAFLITLKDHVCSWFNGIKEASIFCFDQLRKEFIDAFIVNNKWKKDATYLLSTTQNEKETLW